FGYSRLDVAQDALTLLLRDDGSHAHAGIEAIAESQRFRRVDELLLERLVAAGRADDDAAGETPLPGATEHRFGDDADGAIHVGIRHDDDVVLRAAERLDALPVLRRGLVDVARHRARAHERDADDVGVSQQRVDRILAA